MDLEAAEEVARELEPPEPQPTPVAHEDAYASDVAGLQARKGNAAVARAPSLVTLSSARLRALQRPLGNGAVARYATAAKADGEPASELAEPTAARASTLQAGKPGPEAPATRAAPVPKGEAVGAPSSPGPSPTSSTVVAALEVPASGAAEAVLAARGEAGAAVVAEREFMSANPPTLARPSGLPRGEPFPLAGLEEAPPPKGKADVPREKGAPPKPDVLHYWPWLGPLPAPPPELDEEVESLPEHTGILGSVADLYLDAVPTTDEAVNTDPGASPTLTLDGDASPANMGSAIAAHEPAIAARWATARAEAAADFGEERIRPSVPRETLVGKTRRRRKSEGAAREARGEVRADARDAVDVAAAGYWSGAVAEARAKDADAKAEREQGEQDARADAEGEIRRLQGDATEQQLAAIAAGKESVALARAGWIGGLVAADAGFAGKKAKLIADTSKEIQGHKTRADDDAKRQYADAHEKADAKKREAEAEAEAEKQKKKSGGGGVLGWIKSKVKAALSALKRAVKWIFDKLRKAVKAIIERVKEAVFWAIDQARRLVVGALHLFEAGLDLAVDVFLDQFPAAKRKAKEWIHSGISKAESAVNESAEWLKGKVGEALDALGEALDFVLSLYEKAILAYLDVVEFLVVGLIEIIEGIGRLADGAGAMPDHFGGQLEEEGLGMDFSQPLPIERLAPLDAQAAAAGAVEAGARPPSDATLAAKGTLEASDIEVDPVAEGTLDPELIDSLELREGEDFYFGENTDPANTREAVMAEAFGVGASGGAATATAVSVADGPERMEAGTAETQIPTDPQEQLDYLAAQPGPSTCDAKKEEEPAKEDAAVPESLRVYGPFTAWQRAKYMLGQMKTGVVHWWECNRTKILIGFAVGALVALLLGILTGGAIFAAIPPLLELMAAFMAGVAVVKATGYVRDYIKLAWGGDTDGGGKSLARGLAILAIELVFALLFNIGSVIKAAKGGIKGLAKGAIGAAKSAVKATVKAGVELAEVTAKSVRVGIRNSRLIVRGFRRGFADGVKTLEMLTKRVLRRMPFRGFFLRLKKLTLELWGVLNPPVLLETFTLSPRDRRAAKVTKSLPEDLEALVGRAPKAGKTAKAGESLEYLEGTTKGRGRTGDKLTPDHIPSRAALVEQRQRQIYDAYAKSKRLSRELTEKEKRALRLTDAEKAEIRDEALAIVKGEKFHRKVSRTFGGRNTAEQIAEDAKDLSAAVRKDFMTDLEALEASGKLTPETVAIYINHYKNLVSKGVIIYSEDTNRMLLYYLRRAR